MQFNAQSSGSTLISVLIDDQFKLICSNVGDSRALLARQSKYIFI
jgi:serine/threonine protein phosphatase PrpC